MNINGQAAADAINFSGAGFSAQADGDKRRMAATPAEGTAPKLGSGKCAGPTSASYSRVRCDVTAGETAQPKPELLAIIRRGEGVKRLLGLYIGDDTRPLLREGQKVSKSDLERFLAAIERSHAAQPQRSESPWVGKSERRFIEQKKRSEQYDENALVAKLKPLLGDQPSIAKATDDKQEEWTPEYIAKLVGGYAKINETARIILSDHINAALADDDKKRFFAFWRENGQLKQELADERKTKDNYKREAMELARLLDDEREERALIEKDLQDALKDSAAECQRREEAEADVLELNAYVQQAKDKLLSAQAAIEAIRNNWSTHDLSNEKLAAILGSQPSDLLHRHDAEVRKPLVDELQNIVNCDLVSMRKDFGSDTDRQFRLWAQNRARHALDALAKVKS